MSRHNPFKVITKLCIFIGVLISALVYSSQNKASFGPEYKKAPEAQRNASRESSIAFVKRVIDGDTVLLSDGRSVRYLGIDTPETHVKANNRFEDKVQPYGREAFAYNRKLVEGKEIRLEYDTQAIDKYKRTLAYCYVGDVFVNARMIEEGYASVFIIPPNVKYAEEFIRFERAARAARKGLWGVVGIIGPKEAKGCVDQIRAVRGKVGHTYSTKSMVYLNMGNDEQESFTVTIYRKDLKYFKERNIDPESYYLGKTIEVAGRVRFYKTAQIIVSSPGQIYVLG